MFQSVLEHALVHITIFFLQLAFSLWHIINEPAVEKRTIGFVLNFASSLTSCGSLDPLTCVVVVFVE